jgi:hypothetical protein
MPHYIDIVTLSNFYKPLQEQEVDFIFLVNWTITATNTFGLLHGACEEMPYRDLVCLNDVKGLQKEEKLWKTWLRSNDENCWKCREFVGLLVQQIIMWTSEFKVQQNYKKRAERRPGLWDGVSLLYHNNALVCKVASVCQFLVEKQIQYSIMLCAHQILPCETACVKIGQVCIKEPIFRHSKT